MSRPRRCVGWGFAPPPNSTPALSATRNARLAQRYAADNGLKIADEGVQLFGGYGFVRDLPLELWYRNARSLSVLDGLVGV